MVVILQYKCFQTTANHKKFKSMQMFIECTEENVIKLNNFCFAVISNCHKNITILGEVRLPLTSKLSFI